MSATANFRNEVFCSPYGTVYVDYTQRTIGYEDGYWDIDWQGFATGAYCADWLTGYHDYYSY